MTIVTVASNAPKIFTPRDGMQFVPLGDAIEDTNFIVLALKKNWGAGSIEKIDAIRQLISKYPQTTPRYIVGCEATMPDSQFGKYRHAARDTAVRLLCEEVLKGSTSIGVRGEITKQYLVREIGLDESCVDVVFTRGCKATPDPIDRFLKKNNPNLLQLADDLRKFQNNPVVFYERPVEYTSDIGIGRPYLESSADGVRICSRIQLDQGEFDLWCEVDEESADFFLLDRADAFICGLLPFAMRVGKDMKSSAPITEELQHNLNEILIPHLEKYDFRLYRSKILSENSRDPLECIGGVGTGMSCGVDSLYSLKAYSRPDYPSMKLTHLYCGNYLYGNKGAIYDRARKAAQMSNLGFVAARTNITEQLRLPHLPTHFFKTMFGVLCLKRLFGRYYYSSADDFGKFTLHDNSVRDSMYIDLILTNAFSTSDFRLHSGGAAVNRLEKTEFIIDFPQAHKLLNVCLYPNLERNCGKCQKCLRTLLSIDFLGKLPDFAEVFDIDHYKENRISALKYLYSQRLSPYLARVYKVFSETDPQFKDLLKESKAGNTG